MTTFRWYILGLLLLFGAYVSVEYNRPKALDWRPTYQNKDKIPYGTYVLYQVLPEVMGVAAREVKPIRLPVYSQLEGEDEVDPTSTTEEVYLEQDEQAEATPDSTAAPTDSLAEPGRAVTPAADTTEESDYAQGLAESDYPKATYLFVNDGFDLSSADTRALLRHVARGNDVFIAAEQFNSRFADTLGFRTQAFLGQPRLRRNNSQALLNDSVEIFLSNPRLARPAGRSFRFPILGASYRIVPDSALQATQLAADAQGRPVLVRIPHGRGHVYICSVPLAFTNYFVLQPPTSNLAFAALSYLPAGRPVWWDEYQKQGRLGEQSLLRVLLAHDALRRALYLGLFGALLFVLFEARRRQRIIPILKPLPNTTLQFTRTVAGLYRQGSNHTLIAEKKIGLFLEFLRQRLNEPGLDFNDAEARERVAQKSGVPVAAVEQLVRRINLIRTAPEVSDTELLLLSRTLHEFRQAVSK
ncbi:DUF4350 domain-containing protein [Hymenobacter chitinivorans]|uniref:Uncharacterized protein DUF4350 n=1 Tax=Hymenobacter chitinivorans DSM 11115 TaxID=1121954 RepID=A0A2M9AQL9_9BACT|nr:DUF4350 domain-containing protein [Hymenobacter chitinivorans]PJJ47990.1 uncharacterized protein DUF4350 [Hymenobacter chitinivorans DSM 11115]